MDICGRQQWGTGSGVELIYDLISIPANYLLKLVLKNRHFASVATIFIDRQSSFVVLNLFSI